MGDQKFNQSIHLFRGLAILLITSSHLLYTDVNSTTYKVLSALFLNSTLFFAFISGYLFKYLLKSFNYKSYLIRKWKFVVLPYIIISIPALALRVITGPSYMAELQWSDVGSQSYWVQGVYYLATGSHLVPLWYIPMITIYFIAAPLFKIVDDHPKLYWILPILLSVALLLYRTPFNINDIPRMTGHFLFIYVFGMWYCRHEDRIRLSIKRFFYLLMIGWILLFILSMNTDFAYYYQVIFVQKVIAIPLMVELMGKIRVNAIQKMLSRLAETSFGIYFIHFYVILFIRAMSKHFFGYEYPGSMLMWMTTFIVMISISYSTVFVAKRILKSHSRLIIGS
ncbi:MAG: hypothetical protein Tsb0034_13370 [Ekhidna sp.]